MDEVKEMLKVAIKMFGFTCANAQVLRPVRFYEERAGGSQMNMPSRFCARTAFEKLDASQNAWSDYGR